MTIAVCARGFSLSRVMRERGTALLVILAAASAALTATGKASAAELIMFDERGCIWCERFEREVGPIYPKTEEGRRAPLRRIDISLARQSGLKLASAVRATPTFVLVEGGIEVGRLTGYPGQDFFWGLVDELLAKLPPEVAPGPVERRACLGQRPGSHLASRQKTGQTPFLSRVRSEGPRLGASFQSDAPNVC